MTDRPLTIVFMPESAYGPTNNCIGIGKILEQRGHRIVFTSESSWKGKLEPFGFEEHLVSQAPHNSFKQWRSDFHLYYQRFKPVPTGSDRRTMGS